MEDVSMLEQRSALAAVYQTGWIGRQKGAESITVQELRGRNLVQISGWQDSFDGLCHKLQALFNSHMPDDCRNAVTHKSRTFFRIAPERLWMSGPAGDSLLEPFDESVMGADCFVTEINHSRTLLRIEGAGAKTLINRELRVDLDDSVFSVGGFAQSVMHHIPVLVHRVDDTVFDLYIAREYAVTFWEWFLEAAETLGCEIKESH
jgi:sarcosine oxidase subunit gamma